MYQNLHIFKLKQFVLFVQVLGTCISFFVYNHHKPQHTQTFITTIRIYTYKCIYLSSSFFFSYIAFEISMLNPKYNKNTFTHKKIISQSVIYAFSSGKRWNILYKYNKDINFYIFSNLITTTTQTIKKKHSSVYFLMVFWLLSYFQVKKIILYTGG